MLRKWLFLETAWICSFHFISCEQNLIELGLSDQLHSIGIENMNFQYLIPHFTFP